MNSMKILAILLFTLYSIGVDALDRCSEMIADGEGYVDFEVLIHSPSFRPIEGAKVRIARI